MGSLRAIDDLIGTIGASLEAAGELEGTAFLFTSDNGYHYGEHRLAERLPDAYEESIRVPLTMAIPGVTGGQVLRQYITNNDSCADAGRARGTQAGITTDGRSFLPLFDSPTQPWRKRFLVEQWWELGNGNPNQEVVLENTRLRGRSHQPFDTVRSSADVQSDTADPDASVSSTIFTSIQTSSRVFTRPFPHARAAAIDPRAVAHGAQGVSRRVVPGTRIFRPMMMRVHWGMAVLALAVQAPALHATPPAVAAVLAIERPNVVLIIADDLDTATFNRGVSSVCFRT